jgi:hypothetical protein
MPDLDTLKTRLSEAETAYHLLVTGAKEASVNIGGYGMVTYTQAGLDKLEAYISRLRGEIARKSGSLRRAVVLTEF